MDLNIVIGEYISFLDSDDYIESNMYEKLYNHAIKNNLKIDMCDVIWFYPDGTKECRLQMPSFIENLKLDSHSFILYNPSACNKIYKKQLFLENNLFFKEAILYEDLATIPLLAKYTNKIGHLKEKLYFYRQHDKSIMSNEKYNDKMMDILKSCENLYNNLKDTEFIEEVEYIYIFQLMYLFVFKFIKFDKYNEINQCMEKLYSKFPNWKENKYYKQKPLLFKFFCNMVINKRFKIVKMLIKIRRK